MDTLDFIENKGKKIIPNPNYNPKSKKNKQPKYIEVDDLGETNTNSNNPVNMALQDYSRQKIYDADVANKYNKYGLNYNDFENLDKQLADSQSNWSKAFNSLGQAVLSEVVLGTAMGFTDLYDAVVNGAFGENDYQSDASKVLQEAKDYVNEELMPIHIDPNVNIQNGGLSDPAWYFKNLPSVVSSFALLLPTRGIGFVAGKLGKALKVGKATSKARRWVSGVEKIEEANKLSKLQVAINNPKNIAKFNYGAKTAAEALLMRTMENYQEARDTNIQMYQDVLDRLESMDYVNYKKFIESNPYLVNTNINLNDKDAVAKHIASEAADKTFKMDFANVVFDVVQLHGLKNIGKGIKQHKNTGKVGKLQEESKKAAEDFTKGVTTEAVKEPLHKTVAKATWGWLKGNTKTIAKESSEGVEEAINYIASQEGLTYGKALLEGNVDKHDKYFNQRLIDYFKTAELQESAFWGVLGGWFFAGGGNFMNKIKLASDRKAQQELMKENPITGEKIEDKGNWLDLFELPEYRAAREAIARRQARLEQLAEDMKQIDNGIDITAQSDETGKHPTFRGDIETQKALAKKHIQSKFIADMAMDAMNSGTYDLLVDYFQSEGVKKAMIKAGIAEESDINKFTEETVRELNEIKDLYARHSAHVLNQIGALNASKDYDQTIPLQYAQIIAKENVDRILQIKDIDKQIAQTEILVGEQQKVNEELGNDENFDNIKEAVRLGSLIDMYGRLKAEQKEIEELEKTDGTDWKLQSSKAQNKAQLDAVIKEIKRTTLTNNSIGASALFNAIKVGEAYKRNSNNEFEIDKDFKRTDEEILKEVKLEFGEDLNLSDEAVIQTAKSMEQSINNITKENGLANSNRKLLDQFITLAQLNLQKNTIQSFIANTTSQIQSKIDMLHNYMNEGRRKLIDKAYEVFEKALEQYGDLENNGQNVLDVIFKLYKQNKQEARKAAESFMSDTNKDGKITASEFMDALDIFNFTAGTNEGLYQTLAIALDKYRTRKEHARKKAVEEDEDSTETVNTSTDSTITEKSIDSQQSQTNNNRARTPIKFVMNNRGAIVAIKRGNSSNGNVIAYENEDGSLELDISSMSQSDKLRYIRAGLFEGDVDLLDENNPWKITQNPTIRRSGKGYIINSKGIIESERPTQITSPVEDSTSTQIKPTQVEEINPQQSPQQETTSTSVSIKQEETIEPINEIDENIEKNENTNILNENEPQHPSTGEVNNVINEDDKIPTPENYDIDTIRKGIASTVGSYIPDIKQENIDFDKIQTEVKEKLKDKAETLGLSEEELNKEIDDYFDKLRTAHQQILQLKSKLAKSGASLAFAARYEELDDTDFSKPFISAVEAFMKEYEKIVVVPRVDGKQVVKLEDVLRICNNIYATTDNSIVRAMYEVVANYLDSEEGRKKYLTIDLNKGRKVIDNIGKSSKELQAEASDIFDEFQVNIADFIEMAEASNEEDKKRYFEALDSIVAGDKLQIITTGNELIVKKGTITIGNMPKPKIIKDRYVKTNEGWVTDVTVDTNGNIISETKDIFEDIFLTEDKEHDALRSLIVSAIAIDSKDVNYNKKIAELVEEFKYNPVIIDLVNRSRIKLSDNSNKIFIDKKTNEIPYDKLFNHLVKLYNYSSFSANANDKELNKQLIKESLNTWFEKLYQNYDTIYSTKNNLEVEVSQITEGQINRIFNDHTENVYEQLSLIDEALDLETDARIAIVNANDPQVLNISGKPKESSNRFRPGSTVLAISSRNAQKDFVNAFGVRLTDLEALGSSELKDLSIAAMQALYESIENFINDGDFRDINKIEDIIRSIISVQSNTNKIPLFRPYSRGASFEIEIIDSDKSQAKGIQILYKNPLNKEIRRFKLYSTTPNGGYFGWLDSGKYQIDNIGRVKTNKQGKPLNIRDFLTQKNRGTIAKDAARSFMTFVKETCAINIDSQGITIDNVPSKNLTGFITQKNGKLIVDIPNIHSNSYHKEYDSYNDFLVKGNLLRVNLKRGKNGSNFERIGTNQRANQILSVSLPKREKSIKTVTSEEIANSEDYIDTNSDEQIYSNLKNIVATNKENVGIAIFQEIFGQEELDKFKEIATEFNVLDDILPTRAFYDPLMNNKGEGTLAYTMGNRRYVRRGSSNKEKVSMPKDEYLVFGSHLMNLLSSNNPSKRKQAIRKLIHEQLHYHLHQDATNRFNTIVAINEIYEEFVKHVKEDLIKNPNNKLAKYVNKLCITNGYKGETKLEEFLVESLTNKDLFEYLNNIQIDNISNNGKSETLFTKIARAIAKFFGWNIKDNSLYMKQLNILREITSREEGDTKVEDVVKEENIEEKQDETIEESNDFDEFDADYSDFGFDEDSYPATYEELDNVEDGYTKVASLDSFKGRLPMSLQSQFDALERTGWIEIKC